MIWIVFGAMAVATFLAVGQILVDADPARARRQIRNGSIAVWAIGLVLSVAGKPLYGLPLMALGAMGVFAAPRPKRRSRLGNRHADGRTPGGGPDFETDPDAGTGRVGGGRSGVMSEEEAYQVLGVEPGASLEEIGRAHRTLMKKFHPDQGGSTEAAARVNAAKDVLAKRRHD